jgi:hypothetical protein
MAEKTTRRDTLLAIALSRVTAFRKTRFGDRRREPERRIGGEGRTGGEPLEPGKRRGPGDRRETVRRSSDS